MRKLLLAAIVSGSVLAAGCSTLGIGGGDRRQAGGELVGRSARLVTNNGQGSTLRFQQGGRVTALFGRREAAGRWWARDAKLCFEWGGQTRTRECWPYTQPFRRGQTRTVRSDRGNVVKVTLL